MNSIHHRGVTVVTLVVLFFTPVFRNHHWIDVLTGVKTETTIVQCQRNAPCPAFKVTVQKVVLPPQPQAQQSDQGSGQQQQGQDQQGHQQKH